MNNEKKQIKLTVASMSDGMLNGEQGDDQGSRKKS
jgi:hypothetical protein